MGNIFSREVLKTMRPLKSRDAWGVWWDWAVGTGRLTGFAILSPKIVPRCLFFRRKVVPENSVSHKNSFL